MHIVLTLTLMHDRYLSPTQDPKPSTIELYHWYQGTALFNSTLSRPIKNHDRDALWSTAALVGAIAFSSIDARKPEEAWPLKPASSSDLRWLNMSDGKKAIWKLVQPLGPDSIYASVASKQYNNFLPVWSREPNVDTLPAEFVKLYNLGPELDASTNSYHKAVLTLAHLFDMECNHSTILHFLSFISNLDPNYRRKLEEKDPRALLLLAYWFAKLCPYRQWWVWQRAVLECQAICMYLDKYHGHDSVMQKLLQYPKDVCGLSLRP